MANDRFYTVEPMDGLEGVPFTLEGMQAALDKIRETWGGKEHKPAGVYPSLTLGGGAAVLLVEEGRVLMARDDVAREAARSRKAAETEPDGRIKTFYAKATLVRVVGPNKGETLEERAVEGEGLMRLFFAAATFVQEALGDVPDCMSLEACEVRERGIRAQISRAKSQNREGTLVHFPGSNTAPFFSTDSRPGEFYRITMNVLTKSPETSEAAPFEEWASAPMRVVAGKVSDS